jgi:hypothetical protein
VFLPRPKCSTTRICAAADPLVLVTRYCTPSGVFVSSLSFSMPPSSCAMASCTSQPEMIRNSTDMQNNQWAISHKLSACLTTSHTLAASSSSRPRHICHPHCRIALALTVTYLSCPCRPRVAITAAVTITSPSGLSRRCRHRHHHVPIALPSPSNCHHPCPRCHVPVTLESP